MATTKIPQSKLSGLSRKHSTILVLQTPCLSPGRSGDSFGPLFVLNDDLVKGKAGFGAHPHRNAEIFSYVVKGQLSHADNMGNKEALSRGSVQYLSAGSGIVHSEMNDSDEVCRFLQVWIRPEKRGVKPQYGSQKHSKESRYNRWLHLLGGSGKVPDWSNMSTHSSIRLHQDCNVFVSETDPGFQHDVVLDVGRQIYLVCVEGSVEIDGTTELLSREAIELVCGKTTARDINLKAKDSGMHILVIEMTQE